MKTTFSRLFMFFVAFAVLIVSNCLAQQYVATDLGTLSEMNWWASSCAYGINDLGQVVGTSSTSSYGYHHAFCYKNGVMSDLGTLPDFNNSLALDINNKGQIVGSVSNDSPITSQSFLYDQGVMTNIGNLLDNNLNQANAINDNGQIAIGGFQSGSCAYVYYNGLITKLPSPSGRYGLNHAATDINNNGVIVADAKDFYGDWKFHYTTYIYDNGVVTDLGNLLGYPDTSYCWLSAINDRGQIVGNVKEDSLNPHAFIYDKGIAKELPKLNGVGITANDINDKGQIVGFSGSGFAVLSSINGSTQNLNNLASVPLGYTLVDATAINKFGQIAVNGTNSSGRSRAFLLTPTGKCQSYQVQPSAYSPLQRLAKWDGSNWIPISAGELSFGNIHVLVHGWAPGLKDFADDGGRVWDKNNPKTGQDADNGWNDSLTKLASDIKSFYPGDVIVAFNQTRKVLENAAFRS
jgi:probable HAF family extracellular repeat protein